MDNSKHGDSMIKHNPKVRKAYKHYKKTGDSQPLAEELQKQSLQSLKDNKELVTII